MPHQVIHRLGAWVTVTGFAIIGFALAGCTPQDERAGIGRPPIVFPQSGSLPQVWVYGSLRAALPSFDATPVIDRFLYGPNDYGKTVCRNPQGMALVAGRLLVCDQGYQNMLAIDLATGKSMFWCDEDHLPRCPVDIASAGGNRVCVADTTLRAVLVYDVNGRFLQTLAPADDMRSLFRPCAVLCCDEVLYIGNVGQHRIDRYHLSESRWLDPVAPPAGGMMMVAPTGLGLAPDGILLIADAIQGCVWQFAIENERWLPPMGRRGRGLGEFIRPKQVCCTPEGVVLVSDAGRQSVQVFDRQGKPIAEIHERAREWAGWTMPMGLLAVKAKDLSIAASQANQGMGSRPASYVIVSDSLGAESLTLVGIVVDVSEATTNGH